MRPFRSRFVRGALVLLPALAVAQPPPQREARGRPCSPLIRWHFTPVAPGADKGPVTAAAMPRPAPPAYLRLVGARWDVTAVGSRWSGSLATTWANAMGAPVEAFPRIGAAALGVTEAVLVRDDGRRVPIPAGPGGAPMRERREDIASISLMPGQTTHVEMTLLGTLGHEAGRFELELPSILGNCPTEGAAASLEARVEVLGGEPVMAEDDSAFIARTSRDGLVLELPPGSRVDAHPLRAAWTIGRSDETSAVARSCPRPAGRHEVTLVVAAPRSPQRSTIRAKDVVFVLDTSGSMQYEKLKEAIAGVDACLGALRENDAFGLVDFDDDVAVFGDAAVAATPDNLALAREWLAQRYADGKTFLDPGLRAGLGVRRAASAHRLLVVVTDARLGDGALAVETLRDTLGDARLLVVLVGADADFAQARRLADVGRGEVITAAAETLKERMSSLLDAFASPVAWDLDVDWGPTPPLEVIPAHVSDLYAARPLSVRAIFDAPPPDEVRVVGSTSAGAGTFDVVVPVEAREPRSR